jgi:hypothetical protein
MGSSQGSSAGEPWCQEPELASTVRTPRGRSRRGRSPRADEAGQLRRPSTPHVLVQICAAGCRWTARQPSQSTSQTHTSTTSEPSWTRSTTTKPITTHRHHHQPAASTGACGRHSCSAHICSTQQVSGAHTTSRCSSAAVGEGPSRSTVESTSPHSRLHGRRERRDHRANQPSRILSYLSRLVYLPTYNMRTCSSVARCEIAKRYG